MPRSIPKKVLICPNSEYQLPCVQPFYAKSHQYLISMWRNNCIQWLKVSFVYLIRQLKHEHFNYSFLKDNTSLCMPCDICLCGKNNNFFFKMLRLSVIKRNASLTFHYDVHVHVCACTCTYMYITVIVNVNEKSPYSTVNTQ